jgi:hypothetical protein
MIALLLIVRDHFYHKQATKANIASQSFIPC